MSELEPEDREAGLPQWVQRKLHKLRREVETLRVLNDAYCKQNEQQREEAASIDAGEPSGLRYEHGDHVRFLPADGQVYFTVGDQEIELHAIDAGLSATAFSSTLAVVPRNESHIDIWVVGQ